MALAVWTSIRLLRVQAVLAQKVAWVLVLLAAGTMPLVMRSPVLALNRAVQIPLRGIQLTGTATAMRIKQWVSTHPTSAPPVVQTANSGVAATVPAAPVEFRTYPRLAKPPATHSSAAARSSAVEPAENAFISNAIGTSALRANRSMQTPEEVAAGPSVFWTIARIKSWVVAFYLAIGGILLLRAAAGLSIAWRVWRRAKPVVFASNASSLVRVSPDLTTPVTIGSTVILPADYREWDEAKLRVVLAHEQSHVRQGDFYLQLLAAVHVAVFWFSPLGWWLQRKLSELGEALSDRAGLEQAKDPASYARILLEFAAMPRTNPYAGALTGVAMARSSNLSSRIERILNDRRFRLEFLGGRRHALLTALLVPAALVAVVACIRIVPAVEAAQAPKTAPVTGQMAGEVTGQISGQVSAQVSAPVSPRIAIQIAPVLPELVTTVNVAQAPPVPAIAPVAPEPPVAKVEAPQAPAPPEAPEAPRHKHGTHIWINNGDDENFAIVHENGDGTLRWNGEYNDDLAKLRSKLKLKGDYIWFERDGKSYVVTDPAMVAQAEQMFKGSPELERQMKVLEEKQKIWEKKMAELEPEMEKARLPGPEFAAQMAKLNAQLAELQTDKFKKMTEQMNKEFSQEKIGELQEKMGEIQSQLGEIQGRIGERQGEIGEKQGAIGEKMGELGEQMGQIGEKQGQMAEEAARKLRSVLDQAVKDGKAKPVE
jgi:beta-lactamase regulating signal transducer with metallopeptidase domain